jgi:hypothetical protein
MMKASAMVKNVLTKHLLPANVCDDLLDLQVQKVVQDPGDLVQALPIPSQTFEGDIHVLAVGRVKISKSPGNNIRLIHEHQCTEAFVRLIQLLLALG